MIVKHLHIQARRAAKADFGAGAGLLLLPAVLAFHGIVSQSAAGDYFAAVF